MAADDDKETDLQREVDELREQSAKFEAAAELQKKTEAALKESEDRYRDLVEKANIAIAIDDAEGTLTFANEQLARIFGYTLEEMKTLTHRDMVHPGDLERVVDSHRDRLAGRPAPSRYEFRGLRKDGSLVYVEVDVGLRKEGDRIVGTRSYLWDVTERIQAEEQRRRLEARLHNAQKMESLGVLAGGIAHDFNNLLLVVSGNAELASMELEPDSPVHEYIEAITKAAKRAATLSEHMLAYAGRRPMAPEEVDLSSLTLELAGLMKVSIPDNLKIELNLGAALPAVMVDTTRVREVIMSLINNGVEAIGDKPGRITVRTREMECDRRFLSETYVDDNLPAGKYVIVDVSDNGCGMDPAIQAKIFDPFFSTKFTGRGLGLSAVLGIVRGHKGAIRVRSDPGRGSTFTVLFPAAEVRPKVPTAERIVAADWRGDGTVLLADDELGVRLVASEMLSTLGFDVITANDGLEAVETFKQHAEDIVLVLLDARMPRMGGVEALPRILEVKDDVRVILTSGYDERTATQDYQSRGLAGFIHKPYELPELRQAVFTALHSTPA